VTEVSEMTSGTTKEMVNVGCSNNWRYVWGRTRKTRSEAAESEQSFSKYTIVIKYKNKYKRCKYQYQYQYTKYKYKYKVESHKTS